MYPKSPEIGRRAFLAGLAGFAGCSGRSSQSPTPPPTADGRPEGVYVPTHAAALRVVEIAESGRLRCALRLTHPLRFWAVTGERTSPVEADGDVHLLAVVWDDETGRVLCGAEPRLTVSRGDEQFYDAAGWPMLSQRLGFHYGDNVELGGPGTYDVRVQTAPSDTQYTRELEGLDPVAAFQFSMTLANDTPDVAFDTPERASRKGSLEPRPLDGVPVASTPTVDALPGDSVGVQAVGDTTFAVTVVSDAFDGGDAYLAVSPHTPSSTPLPFMTLFATLRRGEDVLFDATLAPSLDPALGYHYAARAPSVETGDELVLGVGAPPQVARHEGYETAFMGTRPVEFTA
ncbi:iron transporter [Halobacterium wangiae]|uniref:iron transporter n=1 Tax=Halobacterium wangiae TaxID=2902623 RepID=UPI001E47CD7E|nr:iron transporter [Halobacterium wangiae]